MSIDNTNEINIESGFHGEKDTALSDEKIEQLKRLSQELDPFNEISNEQKLELAIFGITDFSDPFVITNKILKILEENLNQRIKNGKESQSTSSKH